jgi:hypothetical protein
VRSAAHDIDRQFEHIPSHFMLANVFEYQLRLISTVQVKLASGMLPSGQRVFLAEARPGLFFPPAVRSATSHRLVSVRTRKKRTAGSLRDSRAKRSTVR